MNYYKTDSRKISYREYWHMAPRGFWLAWLNKFLGKQMNLIRGIPGPQPFKSLVIDATSIPGEILKKLNTCVQDLREQGFDHFWYCSTKQSLSGGVAYAVRGLHSSRQVLAKVIYVRYQIRESLIVVFNSRFNDGTILGTTNNKREFNPTGKHIVLRKVGAEAEFLLNLHQKKVAGLSRSKKPKTFAGFEEVAAFEDEFVQQVYDDKIRRGIWVEMTESEVAALRAQSA